MDALGVDSAVVAGYSLGGMVAQELAHRHPHMVVKLILGGTAAQPAPRARERWVTRALFLLGRRGRLLGEEERLQQLVSHTSTKASSPPRSA